jgi:hypothetical protein
MNDEHAGRRDHKRHKKRHGMRVVGRSLKSVILPTLGKRKRKRRRS